VGRVAELHNGVVTFQQCTSQEKMETGCNSHAVAIRTRDGNLSLAVVSQINCAKDIITAYVWNGKSAPDGTPTFANINSSSYCDFDECFELVTYHLTTVQMTWLNQIHGKRSNECLITDGLFNKTDCCYVTHCSTPDKLLPGVEIPNPKEPDFICDKMEGMTSIFEATSQNKKRRRSTKKRPAFLQPPSKRLKTHRDSAHVLLQKT
jgi:hypothetical protein